MIITTTDPITGEDIHNPEFKPFVIEGRGHLAIKIYFESEETRRQYLDIAGEKPATDSNRAKPSDARSSRKPPVRPGITTRLLNPLDVEDASLPDPLS